MLLERTLRSVSNDCESQDHVCQTLSVPVFATLERDSVMSNIYSFKIKFRDLNTQVAIFAFRLAPGSSWNRDSYAVMYMHSNC